MLTIWTLSKKIPKYQVGTQGFFTKGKCRLKFKFRVHLRYVTLHTLVTLRVWGTHAQSWIFPDQQDGGEGTLIIPNTIALIQNAPNPDEAKQLIDYLLSPEVEEKLAQSRSLQIPLNPNAKAPDAVPKLSDVRTYDVDFEAAAKRLDESMRYMQEDFLQ